MKRLILLAAAIIAIGACSSHGAKEYVIHGTVSDPNLEGVQVFLVPLKNATAETVDSVYIKNQKFEFRGTEEDIKDLRIDKRARIGVENLLVITEPGDIYVTLGQVSSGSGTKQNDSLQVWKNITMTYNAEISALMTTNQPDVRKGIMETYNARSRQMMENVGKNTTLGKFLDMLF